MTDVPLTGPLQRLINELTKLPGVGPRSAERIAFHLLKAEKAEALALADSVRDIKERIRPCKRCYNLADGELCSICADPRRDQSQIVVVEQPKDLIKLESTGLITGVYHVLMGHIAPLEGIEPEDLTIAALVERCRSGDVKEVVLATNPNMEGDTTALHITSLLEGTSVRTTRLARGLAPGAHIEYANRAMLEEALRGRRDV
jgi:recombination protein RecR